MSEGDIFDVDRLQALSELMKEHELSELELEQDGRRVRLQRGGVAPLPAAAAPTAAPAAATPSAPAAEAEPDHIVYIKCQMVGSFYSKPDPESSAYVKVGDHVDPETTVCLIEAMKNYIPVPAEVRGEIVAVLVEDGEPVDHGKPLFKVDTSR